jgi:hypothetical protein
MIIKAINEEDFTNYKKPSMFVAFPRCNWKCEKECGKRVCQNGALAAAPDIEVYATSLVGRYLENPITKAVVIGGLEPMDSFSELEDFILTFRLWSNDDIVIYTGYTEEEIKNKIERLKVFSPIVIKFGRFIPGQKPHYDEALGVMLASDNQYAVRW